MVDAMDTPIDTADMLRQLLRLDAYPETTATVERLETHISWVFLTDRFVYKLKKPVRYDFLDFSTLALRRHACQMEQELNQRLAPKVYSGVVPITRDPQGRVAIQGPGEVVEWAVRMRRLPAAAALDVRLREGRLAKHELRRIADFLCHFYNRQPPVQMLTDEYHQAVLAHVRANRAELLREEHGLDPNRVLRIHTAQLLFLHLQAEILESRVCDGRIVEGHGDLRPEHVYLTPTPVVIDCIEFNSEFRQLDVLDELSFLAMECDRLGAPGVGRQLIDYYRETAQDQAPESLVAYYKSYRAAVRAKVNMLRASQLSGTEKQQAREEAEQYLALADSYVRDLYPPLMVIVHGRSGVGKSTVAAALADRLGLVHLQTDRLRRQLFPDRNGGNGRSSSEVTRQDPLERSDEMYSQENRQKVYDVMAEQAEEYLRQGVSIVLDGTFLARSHRATFRELAARQGATTLRVHCSCPLEMARQRIATRLSEGNGVSDAWPGLPELQGEADELLEESDQSMATSSDGHCELDTRSSLPDMLAQLLRKLKGMFVPCGTPVAP
jgi:uncharacterized protein